MGVSFTHNGTIASGHYVLFDVLNYTAYDDLGASHLGLITHYGARPWMLLQGSGGGAAVGNNSLKLTSTNGGDTGTAVLTFQPPYL